MSTTQPAILLVEDEPSLANLYEMLFKKDFNLTVAENYEVAEKYLEKSNPDIVLLDVIIPSKADSNLDYARKVGFNLLKKIKTSKKTSLIPTLILTNLNSPEDRKTAEDLGAEEFIVKANILPKDLLKKVSKILTRT